MSHYTIDYVQKIREQGYRMTPQRQIVLDTVCEQGGHVTACEIYELVNAQQPAINRATVYRILDFFCDLQLVAKAEIGGQTVFEVVGDTPHHHLICRQCEHVMSLPDYHFTELAEHLLTEHGFEADLSHLAITGLCAECRQGRDA
ncbi:MAG: transcriptional repressor [Ardenticatenaceae bacterium]|nr:transcriptional repressor [Anaerolineales bacterium]MCB8937436.1 transcriptional repressor [Ardenticatenaceae bacterium]MCB8975583.1 transcriptional repressor [Ardenticatenaceae bacterium]